MKDLFDRKTCVVAAIALALSSAAADAQVMYAQRANLQILDAPDIAGVPIEIVEQNAVLEVISEAGRWVQVQTPGGDIGWVLNSALADEQASGQGGLSTVLALAGPSLDTAAAGRGVLSDGAREYASNNNYDPALLEPMFEARIRARGTWRNFVRDSGLAGTADLTEEEQ